MKANPCSICTSCLLQSLYQLHQMLSSREVGCLCRAKKDSTIILFSSTMHDIVLVLVKIKGTVYNAHLCCKCCTKIHNCSCAPPTSHIMSTSCSSYSKPNKRVVGMIPGVWICPKTNNVPFGSNPTSKYLANHLNYKSSAITLSWEPLPYDQIHM